MDPEKASETPDAPKRQAAYPAHPDPVNRVLAPWLALISSLFNRRTIKYT
jgi:hypothetical protein